MRQRVEASKRVYTGLEHFVYTSNYLRQLYANYPTGRILSKPNFLTFPNFKFVFTRNDLQGDFLASLLKGGVHRSRHVRFLFTYAHICTYTVVSAAATDDIRATSARSTDHTCGRGVIAVVWLVTLPLSQPASESHYICIYKFDCTVRVICTSLKILSKLILKILKIKKKKQIYYAPKIFY